MDDVTSRKAFQRRRMKRYVMKVLVAGDRFWRRGEAVVGHRVTAATTDVDDGPGRTPAWQTFSPLHWALFAWVGGLDASGQVKT
jgi:hypothetical protein